MGDRERARNDTSRCDEGPCYEPEGGTPLKAAGPFVATSVAEPLALSSPSPDNSMGIPFLPDGEDDSCCFCIRAAFAARFCAVFESFVFLGL